MMPVPVHEVKALLVRDLWLPLAIRGGDQLFPKRRNHKRMKLFTLTNMNYQEVEEFENCRLIKREYIVAWTHSHLEALRLEADLGKSKVMTEGRFDDEINIDSGVISDRLPFDIINLDYFSQLPVNDIGRIEKEINGGQILITLMGNHPIKGFVLLFTTQLDQCDLSFNQLSFPIQQPPGLPNPISNMNDKVEFIKHAINSILLLNNYIIVESNELCISIENSPDLVFSIGFVLLRSS